MRISQKSKSILWSVLDKYDGCQDCNELCDALSRLIQDKPQSCDYLIVYNNLIKIDRRDKSLIDYTIGSRIDIVLFSI
jgi:hypothetical protein